ncbi:acylphosphatase [Candidatus Woesearchaeota archaeon]|nr:acylphosphatase [Candidatus Woesearchaeota archaeon]
MLSYRIIISGDVQGVGFRGSAARIAGRLRLRGWAKNNADGSVEILIQGPKVMCDEFIDWCRVGPPGARVHASDL